jgi:ubiquitin C-terminal hydrolase
MYGPITYNSPEIDYQMSQYVKMSYPPGIIGLPNLNGTCYANSLLQILKHLPEMRTFLKNKKPTSTPRTIFEAFVNTMFYMDCSPSIHIKNSLFDFCLLLRKSTKQFGSSGEDSWDLLMYLKEVFSKENDMKWLNVFDGKLMRSCKCVQCLEETPPWSEDTPPLIIPDISYTQTYMQDLFGKSAKQATECEKCNNRTTWHEFKHEFIGGTPEILLIRLQNELENEDLSKISKSQREYISKQLPRNRIKILTKITIPIKSGAHDCEEYQLIGAILDSNEYGMHSRALCYHDNKYYLIDDINVTLYPIESTHHYPRLLFYRKMPKHEVRLPISEVNHQTHQNDMSVSTAGRTTAATLLTKSQPDQPSLDMKASRSGIEQNAIMTSGSSFLREYMKINFHMHEIRTSKLAGTLGENLTQMTKCYPARYPQPFKPNDLNYIDKVINFLAQELKILSHTPASEVFNGFYGRISGDKDANFSQSVMQLFKGTYKTMVACSTCNLKQTEPNRSFPINIPTSSLTNEPFDKMFLRSHKLLRECHLCRQEHKYSFKLSKAPEIMVLFFDTKKVMSTAAIDKANFYAEVNLKEHSKTGSGIR